MKLNRSLVVAVFVLVAPFFSVQNLLAQTSLSVDDTTSTVWNFDNDLTEKLPNGWRHGEEDKPNTPSAWQIISAQNVPSPSHVLAMTTPSNGGFFGLFGRAYNLTWTDEIIFLDGEISVLFKAIDGKKDQGGGIMWRVQDKDNYYVARYNPLEDNFVAYFVRNGARQELISARVSLSENDWHIMKITQRGNEFEGYLDGVKLLNGSSNLFRTAGGIGLWTKADAITWFDDFTVTLAE